MDATTDDAGAPTAGRTSEEYEAEVEELKRADPERTNVPPLPTGWNDPEHCRRVVAFFADCAEELAEAERAERLRPSPPGGKPTACGPLEALGIVGTADTQWTAPKEREEQYEEQQGVATAKILKAASELDRPDRPPHAELYKLRWKDGMTVKQIVEVTGKSTKVIRNMLEDIEKYLPTRLSRQDVAPLMGTWGIHTPGSRSRWPEGEADGRYQCEGGFGAKPLDVEGEPLADDSGDHMERAAVPSATSELPAVPEWVSGQYVTDRPNRSQRLMEGGKFSKD